jgi:signal recognition particle receptor subunit beta
MLINKQRGEINFKIVYYGVAEGGKTTNLEYIHSHINPNQRTKLISIKTEGDRTLYFDFLHIELSAINGFKPKFNFYTVPGQTVYSASRKLVLRGADGVVFVADSQEQRIAENHASLAELRVYLNGNGNGRSFSEFPFILQCNKQDLPAAIPAEKLREELELSTQPYFGTVATAGDMVFDTMKAIINRVTKRLS